MNWQDNLGIYFKSEIKSSGLKLFSDGKISLHRESETSFEVRVKVNAPTQIQLKSPDLGSELLIAKCNCPAARKNQFCKHLWAALLAVDQKDPIFLRAKRSLEKKKIESETRPSEAKLRAAEFRKASYRRQKQRAAELRAKRRKDEKRVDLSNLSEDVKEALAYFERNGFPMPRGPDDIRVTEAKRKLARVFHPDRGGSNEEMTELNRNCEILLERVVVPPLTRRSEA